MTKRSPGSSGPGRICAAALALIACRVSQSAFTTRISRNWVRKIAQSAETQTRGRPGRQAAVIMMDKVHRQQWVDGWMPQCVWHRDGEAWRQNADNFCGNKLQKAITKPKHTHALVPCANQVCVCVSVCVVGVASTAVRHLVFRYCALIARNLRQANPARRLVISPRWAVKTPL